MYRLVKNNTMKKAIILSIAIMAPSAGMCAVSETMPQPETSYYFEVKEGHLNKETNTYELVKYNGESLSVSKEQLDARDMIPQHPYPVFGKTEHDITYVQKAPDTSPKRNLKLIGSMGVCAGILTLIRGKYKESKEESYQKVHKYR